MGNGYEERKQRVVKQLNKIDGGSVGLNKDTSNLFRSATKAQQKLDVKDFNHVLEVNAAQRWAEVEGMTTYETFVDATLAHGMVPTVAPELKSITVGGAIAGVGIESSSFKYGFVHETVLEMDVLTGRGGVVTCSPKEHADLFYAIPNSYGTLGYVLRAKVMIAPAEPYVEITRTRYNNYKEYVDTIVQQSLTAREQGTYDYIDGLIFSKDEMYLTLGRFVDNAPFVSDYTYMSIFYKSMGKSLDYLKTKDYIFRYDTDWFWTTKAMGLENPLLRRLLGKKRLRSDVYYKMLQWENKHKVLSRLNHALGHRTEALIQDAELPAHQAADFIAWFHRNITDTKPLTIGAVIPVSSTAHFTLFPMDPNEIYMNIGYYASLPSDEEEGYYNRLFEKKLLELGAKKMMYSDSYYTREEFWHIFNQPAYNQLKAKYDPKKKFPNLFDCIVKRIGV